MSTGRLQRAIERFDLESYVDEQFHNVRRAAHSSEMRVNCFAPNGCNGNDINHKLYINHDKKQWICFKCGYGKKDTQPGTGSLIRFMADVEDLHPVQIRARLLEMVEPTPAEEFEDVLRMAFEAEEQPLVVEPPRVITLPKNFYPLRPESGMVAKRYVNFALARGLNEDEIRAYNLSFCHKETGELRPWSGRIVFPVYDLDGVLRSAVGRTLPTKAPRPKWTNWPDTDIGALLWPLGFHSHGHGNGMWCGARDGVAANPKPTILVEGVFDARGAQRARLLHPCRCTFGKKISDDQIELLLELGVKEVILAWDKDAKNEIKAATTRLQESFVTSVFPFHSKAWDRYDLGDALTGLVDPKLIEQELKEAIPVDSNEFLAWLFEE